MGHAAFGRVHRSAAELLLVDLFARHGLYDFRSGHEHVAGALVHHNEVGQRGRIYGAAGAGAENGRNLRNHARGEDVALEDLGVARKAVDTLLDTRSARVVDADQRRAVFHCHVHDLADFGCEGFGKRTAEDGEVLREDIYQTAVDRAVTGYHAVAEVALLIDAEVRAAVFDEHVELLERTFVEKHFDTLAGGQFAFFML